MTTLATMKSRISSEIRRSDLTTQIASAITTAIEAYQNERFYFNETREMNFATVASQEFYASSDDADIGNLEKIDYVKLMVDNFPYTLGPEKPDHIERLSQNGTQTGEPLVYCYYGEKIRLYPIPDQVYTVRIGGVITRAAPASDSEANNVWMTEAERLIRCRAKHELYFHVLMDYEKAAMFSPDNDTSPTSEAYRQLKHRTIDLGQNGTGYLVTPTCF